MLTHQQAVRFLHAATFGPKTPEFQYVLEQGELAWLYDQSLIPPTLHRPKVLQLCQAGGYDQRQRQAVWWERALTAPDQLRQRFAFAISEILVISDVGDALYTDPVGMAAYYDILLTHCFGTWRDLLYHISKSPQMGRYLSHLRNSKANPSLGTTPDENYAREIMQLFSIGLWQLADDGSQLAGPLPTYVQADVGELARVFTGWMYANSANWYDNVPNDLPMVQFPAYHDVGSKQVMTTFFPANQTGEQDLLRCVDMLFNHPSCAPFICRQLIQRLTHSNPPAAYISAVVAAWRQSGGDLKTVLVSILLNATYFLDTDTKKFREPLLQATNIWRSLDAITTNGTTWDFDLPDYSYGQAALRAPSVFNFFSPFANPPEAQLWNAVNVLNIINGHYRAVYEPGSIRLDWNPPPNTANTLSLLMWVLGAFGPTTGATYVVSLLSFMLRANNVLAAEATEIEQAMATIPSSRGKIEAAIYLMMASPRSCAL